MYAAAPLGLGAMIMGIATGQVLDKCGPIATVHMINAISCITLVVMIVCNEVGSYWLQFVSSFFLGMMDAAQITFIHVAMGFEFDSKITPFAA